MHPRSSLAEKSSQLVRDGYTCLQGLYPPPEIAQARQRVLEHIPLLRNTRPNPSSGHLAGFHRYPELEPLHTLLSGQADILDVLRAASQSPGIRSIGLSDITVNRSQEWHVDLLRGRYQRHLSADICWGGAGGGVYKVLWYLQGGRSLKVVPGAHTRPIELHSDQSSQPQDPSDTLSIGTEAGDVILMDIRLPHRGSSEQELCSIDYRRTPKILVSTVLGAVSKPLTRAMEAGNFERLHDWDMAHQNHCQPAFF